MAEEKTAEPTELNQEALDPVSEDMDLVGESAANAAKRAREEEGDDDVSKKQKMDKSVEEERLEKLGGEQKEEEEEGDEEKGETAPVSLGPKSFGSSVEMFDYFYNFLHYWPPNININQVNFRYCGNYIKE